ncbi:hypothetical protein CDD81_7789 [Ophiocordyceps australis]|uniref:Zn(2)-C6 fungal-type domain-containing protein n=1 Tax=Ophiocordyceps australis TaxID=1399860 RepID=A0A2C5Y4Q9_9HYPO|nr:hypothetical protein CDD81_7789 [Ophiocordyceps australis]
MPNTGKPSQDCHLCRKRRVKCDLGRPGCTRCAKYGVECPGYRDLQDLVFRNGHPGSSDKKRQRRIGARSGSRGSDRPDHGLGSPAGRGRWPVVGEESAMLPRSLGQARTAQSVAIMLDIYSEVRFLVHEYNQASATDGPLFWATHLFSHTYMTNVTLSTAGRAGSEDERKREAALYLNRTLQSVAKGLEKPRAAFQNDLLAAIWVFANYELLVGTLYRGQENSWCLHTRGLYSMLQARGPAQLSSLVGRQAFWPCFNMIVEAFIKNRECPPETESWLGIISATMDAREAYLLPVSIFMAHAARLQARMHAILKERDVDGAARELFSLAHELAAAEEELNRCITASGRHYETNAHDFHMHTIFCSGKLQTQYSLELLADFLTHFGQRHSHSMDKLHGMRLRCLGKMHAAAQCIIDAIPRFLGDLSPQTPPRRHLLVGSIRMIWPAMTVYKAWSALPAQKEAARKALLYIGKEAGLHQALCFLSDFGVLPDEARRPLDWRQGGGALVST